MHPEKYVVREEPVDVDLPDDLAAKMGTGWSVGLEDTFGEFQLKTWLDQQPAAAGSPKASDAAAGWGGDRIMLLDGPNGAWAIALADGMGHGAGRHGVRPDGRADRRRTLDGTLTPGPDGKTATVLLASDDATRESLQAALGQ